MYARIEYRNARDNAIRRSGNHATADATVDRLTRRLERAATHDARTRRMRVRAMDDTDTDIGRPAIFDLDD
jgi:hypothetical protein